jgi:hypothetical protein
MEPREWGAWLAAAGATVAAASAWGVKGWNAYWRARRTVRKVKKAEAEEEADDQGIPYRKAWQAQSKAVEKALEGMAKLTAECTDWRVRVAKLESDNEHYRQQIERQVLTISRLEGELTQAREEHRKLWEEVRTLKTSGRSDDAHPLPD